MLLASDLPLCSIHRSKMKEGALSLTFENKYLHINNVSVVCNLL